MPHSFVSQLVHCVFSTKNREPWIVDGFRDRLYSYMAGVARREGILPFEIGGIEDHIHVLLSLPATMSLSQAIKLIKGASSRWVSDTFPDRQYFSWQEGYGAFSIGISQMARTKAYIRSQPEHHRTLDFDQEMREILQKHGLGRGAQE